MVTSTAAKLAEAVERSLGEGTARLRAGPRAELAQGRPILQRTEGVAHFASLSVHVIEEQVPDEPGHLPATDLPRASVRRLMRRPLSAAVGTLEAKMFSRTLARPREVIYERGVVRARSRGNAWLTVENRAGGFRHPNDPTWLLDPLSTVSSNRSVIAQESVDQATSGCFSFLLDLLAADEASESSIGIPYRNAAIASLRQLPTEVRTDATGRIALMSYRTPEAYSDYNDVWVTTEFISYGDVG